MSIRRDRLIAFTLLLLLAAGFWWSQRRHSPEPSATRDDAPAAAVSTALARRVEIPVAVLAVGTVRSRHQTHIAPRVLAEIKEVRVAPGDVVARGQVLVLLDDRDLAARVAQADAQWRAREQARAEAEVDVRRARGLLPSGAGTQQNVDAASFRLATTVAELEAAAKALEVARIELGHATIQAPFAGYISEKLAEPGDLAMPGRPVLGLYDPKQLRLEAVIDEGFLWRLKVGDPLDVHLEALDRWLQGTVSEVVPAVDPASRTGLAKVDLPPDPVLRPGMFGRARIVLSRREAVAVPKEAVVERGQLEMVFVLPPGGARAELRVIRAGAAIADPGGAETEIEILSGLDAGETVATAGARALRDGSAVTPASPQK